MATVRSFLAAIISFYFLSVQQLDPAEHQYAGFGLIITGCFQRLLLSFSFSFSFLFGFSTNISGNVAVGNALSDDMDEVILVTEIKSYGNKSWQFVLLVSPVGALL